MKQANAKAKRKIKPIEFIRYGLLSEYGIGALIFHTKENAQETLNRTQQHEKIKIVKIKIVVVAMRSGDK